MASPRRPSVVPSSSSYTAQLSPSLVRNPLHLKVNRILSTNFEDPGTRQALDILGEYELATGSLGLALRKGGLRKQVEHRIAAGSREFLSAFDHVNDVSTAPRRPSLHYHRNCSFYNRISTR